MKLSGTGRSLVFSLVDRMRVGCDIVASEGSMFTFFLEVRMKDMKAKQSSMFGSYMM